MVLGTWYQYQHASIKYLEMFVKVAWVMFLFAALCAFALRFGLAR
jgi:hypothetical protein